MLDGRYVVAKVIGRKIFRRGGFDAGCTILPSGRHHLSGIWTFHDFDVAAVCAPDAGDLFGDICMHPLLEDLDQFTRQVEVVVGS